MEEMTDALKEGFAEYGVSLGKNPDTTLQKCVKLCNKYSIDAENFLDSWIAYAATGGIAEVEEAQLDVFEKKELSTLKDEFNTSNIIPDSNLKFSAVKKDEVFGKSVHNDSDDDSDNDGTDVLQVYGVEPTYTGTPKTEKKPTARFKRDIADTAIDFSPGRGYSPAAEAKSASYGTRTKAGDTVLRYKCKDSDYWRDITGGHERIEIIPFSSTKIFSKTSFKYMFQRTMDMAAAMNTIMADTGYDIMVRGPGDEMEPQDLRVSSMEDCWYLGRIRNDDGRLSQGSTFLEGDIDISGGHVVSLDLSGVDEFRLFPGQVVLVKGKNELGNCLRVTEFAVAPGLPLPELETSKIRPVNIIVAAGPFSPIDSVQYEPLKDLMNVITRDTPDICILVGPFIDPTHPLIGEIKITFDEYFEKMLGKLERAISNLNVQIVIVSSCRDAHHHAVYPTPPYDTNKRYNKITVLPDPAMFDVAGIKIGLTSMDILKHLANTEISKSTITDRMGGLSKLLLTQRSFYPLYPPDESVPLDVQIWTRYCTFAATPHILILPSDLRYFFKEVDGTIVINPERLAKGKSGGTYARFQVKHSGTVDKDVRSVADFCTGEIIKI